MKKMFELIVTRELCGSTKVCTTVVSDDAEYIINWLETYHRINKGVEEDGMQ